MKRCDVLKWQRNILVYISSRLSILQRLVPETFGVYNITTFVLCAYFVHALIVNLELKSCYIAAVQSISIIVSNSLTDNKAESSVCICIFVVAVVVVEGVPLLEFMYLTFTRMPGESYRWVFVVVLVLRISSAISPCVLFSAFRFYFSLVEC